MPDETKPQAPTTAAKAAEVAKAVAASLRPRGGRAEVGDYLIDSTIVAKPLMGNMDLFAGFVPKNPNVVFRGINFAVPTKDGNSGARYEQAKAQGFVNATPEDCANTVPATMLRDGNKIVIGDLILMKIDKALYRGALKWKDQQALRSVRQFTDATQQQGKLELQRAMQEVNAPPKLARKLSPFSPTEAELAKDFGSSE